MYILSHPEIWVPLVFLAGFGVVMLLAYLRHRARWKRVTHPWWGTTEANYNSTLTVDKMAGLFKEIDGG